MEERATKAVRACLFPAFSIEMDSRPVTREDFKEFRCVLDEQLLLLLDILYQNSNLLQDDVEDNQTAELQVMLILLHCEQDEPLLQSDQKILVQSLSRLVDENIKTFRKETLQKVIKTYKESLPKDGWKNEFGLVHGFPKFCEIILIRKPEVVDSDLLLFMLSVGSNLISHYDPHYKTLGMRIYRHLMEHSKASKLKELNIQQVIFNDCFGDLGKCNELDFTEHLYECLYHVVLLEDSEVKNSKWCKFDEVFGNLLNQLGKEGNSQTTLLLVKKIIKFCTLTFEIKEIALEVEHEVFQEYFEHIKTATSKENLRTMRWTKSLLQTMLRESPKLFSAAEDSYKLINAFHFIFIATVLNMGSDCLNVALKVFNEKLGAVLNQVTSKFREDPNIQKASDSFLVTVKSSLYRKSKE